MAVVLEIEGSSVLVFEENVGIVGLRTIEVEASYVAVFCRREVDVVDVVVVVLVVDVVVDDVVRVMV